MLFETDGDNEAVAEFSVFASRPNREVHVFVRTGNHGAVVKVNSYKPHDARCISLNCSSDLCIHSQLFRKYAAPDGQSVNYSYSILQEHFSEPSAKRSPSAVRDDQAHSNTPLPPDLTAATTCCISEINYGYTERHFNNNMMTGSFYQFNADGLKLWQPQCNVDSCHEVLGLSEHMLHGNATLFTRFVCLFVLF